MLIVMQHFLVKKKSTLQMYFNDIYIKLLTSTWGVTSGADYVSPERLAQLEIILFEKIR